MDYHKNDFQLKSFVSDSSKMITLSRLFYALNKYGEEVFHSFTEADIAVIKGLTKDFTDADEKLREDLEKLIKEEEEARIKADTQIENVIGDGFSYDEESEENTETVTAKFNKETEDRESGDEHILNVIGGDFDEENTVAAALDKEIEDRKTAILEEASARETAIEETKEYIDDKITSLGSVLEFKGVISEMEFEEIKSYLGTIIEKGDLWIVRPNEGQDKTNPDRLTDESNFVEYVCTTAPTRERVGEFEKLGPFLDLTIYAKADKVYTKTEIDGKVSTLNTKIEDHEKLVAGNLNAHREEVNDRIKTLTDAYTDGVERIHTTTERLEKTLVGDPEDPESVGVVGKLNVAINDIGELDDQVAAIEGTLNGEDGLVSKVAKNEGNIGRNTSDIAALHDAIYKGIDNADNDAEKEGILASLNSTMASLSSVSSALSNVIGKVDDVSTGNSALGARTTNLENEVNTIKEKLDKDVQDDNSLTNRVVALETSVNNETSGITALNKGVKANHDAIDVLVGKVAAIEADEKNDDKAMEYINTLLLLDSEATLKKGEDGEEDEIVDSDNTNPRGLVAIVNNFDGRHDALNDLIVKEGNKRKEEDDKIHAEIGEWSEDFGSTDYTVKSSIEDLTKVLRDVYDDLGHASDKSDEENPVEATGLHKDVEDIEGRTTELEGKVNALEGRADEYALAIGGINTTIGTWTPDRELDSTLKGSIEALEGRAKNLEKTMGDAETKTSVVGRVGVLETDLSALKDAFNGDEFDGKVTGLVNGRLSDDTEVKGLITKIFN